MILRSAFALLMAAAFLHAQPAAPASPAGVDKAAMNTSVDPCVDFYQYACGNWIASHPLPPDRARLGRFAELQDRNEKVALGILQAAADPKATRTQLEERIGDLFASCMNTESIERLGIGPIQDDLDRIAAMREPGDLISNIVRLQRRGVGVLFSFGSRPDPKDSTRTIAYLSQGGLSLPDRDYYLKTDAKSVEIRQRYLEHVGRMFQLAGDTPQLAAEKARLVVDMETALAQASMDRVSMRDPNRTYHIMTREELRALAPSTPFDQYLNESGSPRFETLNVAQPDFIKQLATVAPVGSMAPWQAYFAYHLLHTAAPLLSSKFENENFDFWQRYLAGVKEPRPRANRCLAAVDQTLGDLLGQKYVEVAFGGDSKARISNLVQSIENAMGKDIQSLPWMSAETKKAALEKLKAITNNVGYPQKWRAYRPVTIVRDDFIGNTFRLSEVNRQQQIEKIGETTDKTEWSMTTPTVNAFYSPPLNSINFPAGILQFPFFDAKRDIAVNLGAIGAVIGHEISHGFDDQGRKYDGAGNLHDWWTAQDGAEFEKRAACIVEEYGKFSPVDGVNLNGRLTLGENTADNGGLRVAYIALEEVFKGKQEKLDGFTPEQRLFLGFGQQFCDSMSPQEARTRAMTDPHSPGRFRVNGTMPNMPEFQKAFSCKPGQPMVSANACRVW